MRLRELEQEVWNERDITSPYDATMFAEHGWVFVARESTCIVGGIVAILAKDGSIFVVDWVVKDQYRRQGVGTQLYKKLISALPDKRVLALVSVSNRTSLLAHQKLGFGINRTIENAYGVAPGRSYHELVLDCRKPLGMKRNRASKSRPLRPKPVV